MDTTHAKARYYQSLDAAMKAMTAAADTKAATYLQSQHIASALYMQSEVLWTMLEGILGELRSLRAAVETKRR